MNLLKHKGSSVAVGHTFNPSIWKADPFSNSHRLSHGSIQYLPFAVSHVSYAYYKTPLPHVPLLCLIIQSQCAHIAGDLHSHGKSIIIQVQGSHSITVITVAAATYLTANRHAQNYPVSKIILSCFFSNLIKVIKAWSFHLSSFYSLRYFIYKCLSLRTEGRELIFPFLSIANLLISYHHSLFCNHSFSFLSLSLTVWGRV
jgi:hypothetical protein